MKTKDDKRIYNVFFNTHTVSGIVVAIVLYIMFLAGGFSFFRDEIDEWEFNRVAEKTEQAAILDYDKIFENLKNNTKHNLYGRDISIRLRGNAISVRGTKSFDTIDGNGKIINNKRVNISLDKETLLPITRGNQRGNQIGGSNQSRTKKDSISGKAKKENTTQKIKNKRGGSENDRQTKNIDSVKTKNEANSEAVVAAQVQSQTRNREGRNRNQAATPTVDMSRLRGIGDIVYRLHFLTQMNYFDIRFGRYISGIVSLLLLFATITGVIVHWKKIIEFFYTFRVDLSLKKIWKDSHTILGVLTTPLLIIYGLTGVLFMIRSQTMTTDVQDYLFEGSRELTNKVMSPSVIDKLDPLGETFEVNSINSLIAKIESIEKYPFNKNRVRISIKKFGDKNATLSVSISKNEDEKLFLGRGQYIFKIDNGELLYKNTLSDNKYTANIRSALNKLHYASFGGIFNRVLYFIFTMAACWVFLSGVLIWLGERKDNRKISPKRKIFNAELIYVYLAVAFGLHIAIANGFILAKILPFDTLHVEQIRNSNFIHTRRDLLSVLFFTSWLLFSVFLYLLKNNFRIFKISLGFHGVLALFIPVLNGFIDKQWFWISYKNGQMGSFFIDILWFVIGVASIYMAIKIKEDSLPKRKVKTTKPEKTEKSIVSVRRKERIVVDKEPELVDFITKPIK
ncbi:MAG TPA: hypothetical protein DDZ39_10325 [Flavobacteriaceae bacterium]|nr:hypothetical protein [Flavobacteriaceae bacterium]